MIFYATFNFARLEIFKMLLGSFFPLALLILAVLGSIVFGLATPSEAAAAGALGGLLLAAAYGRLKYDVVRDSVYLTAKTSARSAGVCRRVDLLRVVALLGGQEIIGAGLTSLGCRLSNSCCCLKSSFYSWMARSSGRIIVIFMPIFVPCYRSTGGSVFFGLLVA